MSPVTQALSLRTVEAPTAAPARRAGTLADLAPGRSATIVDVRCPADPIIARRLCDLGFAPGAPVEVVRRAPLADPVIFRVAGYDIALRRAQARLVGICTAP